MVFFLVILWFKIPPNYSAEVLPSVFLSARQLVICLTEQNMNIDSFVQAWITAPLAISSMLINHKNINKVSGNRNEHETVYISIGWWNWNQWITGC